MTTLINNLQVPYLERQLLDKILNVVLVFIIAGAAVVGGYVTARFGLLAVPVVSGLLVVMGILIFGQRIFFAYMIFLLIGYLFGGRGFGYIGFFPVFVSEVGLALGFLTIGLLPFSPRLRANLRWIAIPLVPLVIFFALQVVQTIPYITTYKFDALRDAMMYLYAFYAVLVGLLIPKLWLEKVFNNWARLAMIFILCVPLLYVFTEVVEFPIRFAGRSIIGVKHGDIGVHLGGAGAFLLLRLDRRGKKPLSQFTLWMLWLFWGLGWLLFGSYNRAGMLSSLCVLGVTVLLWYRSNWIRPAILVTLIISIMLATGAYSNLSIPTGKGREISAEQIVNNFVSIFAEGEEEGGLQATKEWRLNWWSDIVNYTVHGDYFWTGKGYGINLAESDGYVVKATNRLRSPHNSHMNYLARSGVPGFAMWIAFLVVYYAWMMRQWWLNRVKNPGDAKIALWLMAYTVGFNINAMFDLVMESPFAAIWFWCLIGMSFVYFGRPEKAEPRYPLPMKPSWLGKPTYVGEAQGTPTPKPEPQKAYVR